MTAICKHVAEAHAGRAKRSAPHAGLRLAGLAHDLDELTAVIHVQDQKGKRQTGADALECLNDETAFPNHNRAASVQPVVISVSTKL
ncbi:hypothetical protein ACK9YZ_34335 (plasmid) [Rhizobium sp. ZK1]